MNQSFLVTKAGLDQLKKELEDLNQVRRPALVSRLSLARSMGDLSENSDYINAKEELAFTDGRISELEEIVRNAKVSAPTSNDKVDLGHMVTLKVNSSQVVFHIVGEWEAKPSEKRISLSSPLGLALKGKTVGEKVEVPAPAGKVVYTVIKIDNQSK